MSSWFAFAYASVFTIFGFGCGWKWRGEKERQTRLKAISRAYDAAIAARKEQRGE